MRRFALPSLLLLTALAASHSAAQVSFAPEVKIGVRDGPYSVAVADFDSDGFDDIVAVNRWSNNISILLIQTDGTFGNPRHIRVGTSPAFVLPADLDGDGDVDQAEPIGRRDQRVVPEDGLSAHNVLPEIVVSPDVLEMHRHHSRGRSRLQEQKESDKGSRRTQRAESGPGRDKVSRNISYLDDAP